jgi:D-glycero-D-manno-heptose 1,7-bisphosphate phosphatase
MNALRKAVFLDRDGVLNEDLGYVHRREDFHWLAGVLEALAAWQAAGYAMVVITNQSGIARGLYGQHDLDRLHSWMGGELAAAGLTLDGIYACPHLPEAPEPAYRLSCDCRKPEPGMILQAARELQLDLPASWLFGDKPSDIEAGRRAGVGHCWLIGSAKAAQSCGADGASSSLIAATQATLGAAANARR